MVSSFILTQTRFHYVHLAEQVTATAPTGLLINQMKAAFAPQALSPQAATAAAIQTIINQLMGQANMLAITVAAIVLVLLIPIHPQPKGKGKPVLME